MGSVLNLDSYIYSELSWKVLESTPAPRKQEYTCYLLSVSLSNPIKSNKTLKKKKKIIADVNLIMFSEFQVLMLNKQSCEVSRSNLCELSNVL